MTRFKNPITVIKSWNFLSTFKTLLPYFIAILSGVTMYFISNFLNRDIITVQSVFVRPKEVSISLEGLDTKLCKLIEYTSFDDYYQNEIKSLTNAQAIQILDSWEQSLQYAKEDYENSKKPKQINNDGVDESLYYTDSISAKSRLTQYENAIKALSFKIEKTLEDNNDEFQIEVVVFNEGNQQTVIRNKGKLNLGDISVDLKNVNVVKTDQNGNYNDTAQKNQSSAYSSNYVIIEPKSFIVLNLELDLFNNNNRDYAKIQKEYKRESNSNTTLILYDIKNKPIKSFEFLLQNDIEYDPNLELKKRISKY